MDAVRPLLRCQAVAGMSDRRIYVGGALGWLVAIIVDHLAVARGWSDAMHRAGRPLDVLIKVDVGFHRCGIDPDRGARDFVRAVASMPGLRLRGLLSHAGHGSVMKALWHGRPMVLVPWGRDQPGVAARAAALGVAEVVPCENASAETLSAAVDSVLRNEQMRREAERHRVRLRATDPPEVAAGLLETLL